MKRGICSALIFCLCCSWACFAVHAEEEYPVEGAVSDNAYRKLLSKNEADSWDEIGYTNNCSIDVANGVVSYTPNDEDNCFFFRPSSAVVAAETEKIELRMKIPVKISELKIYFENELGLSEERTFILTGITPSDDFQTIEINTATNPAWSGTITLYRFTIGGAVGKTFEVDYVHFYSRYNPPYTDNERCLLYDFDSKNYGFEGNESVSEPIVYNSELWVRTAGEDAALTVTNPDFALEAALVPHIRLSYNNQTPGTKGKLYFVTESMPEYSDECSFTFDVQSGQAEYNIDTEENANWKGTVTGIRFVPSDAAGIVRIGSIRFGKFLCTVESRDGAIFGSGSLYGKMGRLTVSAENTETGELDYKGAVRTNLNGEFEFSIVLENTSVKPVIYDLLFEGVESGFTYKKKVLYTSADYMEQTFAAINAARADKDAVLLQSLIEDNYGPLRLQAKFYESLAADGQHMEQLYANLLGTAAADISELESQLNEAAVLVCVKYMSASKWLAAVDDFDGYLNLKTLSAYTTYAAATDALKEKIMEKMSGEQCEGFAAAREAFQKNVILTSIKWAVAWGDVKAVLQTNAELLKIDIAKAEKLQSPSKAYRRLTEKKFDTLAEVKKAFDDAVAEQLKSENTQKPSGGSGSGGGGGYSSVFVPDPKKEEIIKPEDNPNTKPDIEQPTGFQDLSGYEWAKNDIETLYAKGIVNGTGNASFEPSREVRREEFVKMLTLAFGLPLSAETEFRDVPSDEWYAVYVGAALKAGFICGQGEMFGVGQTISRQDAAVMAARALKMDSETVEMNFSDSTEIDDYAKAAVSALAQAGILKGSDDGMFRPNGVLNRAEAAVMLNRVMGRIGQ